MNIIYLNTTEKKPSGGSNTIYKHSNIINNFKINNLTSEVLHLRKSKFSKFKISLKKKFKIHTDEYGWKFNEITIDNKHKIRWISNLIKIRKKFNFNSKKDFIILPEIWAHLAKDLLIKKNIRYAIFVQNGYAINSTFDRKTLINSYKKADFILSYSKDITKCIKTAFNLADSKIVKINISINSEQKFNKKNIITYMPRKLQNHSSILLFFIKTLLPKGWIIKKIDQLNEKQVFNVLKQSKIFLSFSDMEGLGIPPIEAAILGNKVIGYTGQGGTEYWRRPLFERIENGNIMKFCKTILTNLKSINKSWIKKTQKDREKLIYKYSPEQEREKLLKMINRISAILN